MVLGNKCAHGYTLERKVPIQESPAVWVINVAPECPICDGQVGIKFKDPESEAKVFAEAFDQ